MVGVCMQKGMLATTMLVVLAHSLNRPLDAVTMHIFGIVLIFMNDSILSLVNIVYNLLCSLSKKKNTTENIDKANGQKKSANCNGNSMKKSAANEKSYTRLVVSIQCICVPLPLTTVCLPYIYMNGKAICVKKEGSLHWHLIFNHVPCMSHRQSS